jgi:hypothetical protein
MKSAHLTTVSPHRTQAKLPSGSDPRVTRRFWVQFRTVMAAYNTMIEHTGSVLDLSLIGCRVEAP